MPRSAPDNFEDEEIDEVRLKKWGFPFADVSSSLPPIQDDAFTPDDFDKYGDMLPPTQKKGARVGQKRSHSGAQLHILYHPLPWCHHNRNSQNHPSPNSQY